MAERPGARRQRTAKAQTADRPAIRVVAGALTDAEGRVLIAQRPRGRHLAGRWEFPGGKLETGEEPLAGLRRELDEELGVRLRAARPLIRLRHDYPERRVLLDVWHVAEFRGEPQPLDGQGLAWVAPDDLHRYDLLEADRAIVTALRLPRRARVIERARDLVRHVGRATEAILYRPAAPELAEPDAEAVQAVRGAGHRVLVLGEGVEAFRLAALTGADGAVLRWQGQRLHVDGAGSFLIGARCSDRDAAVAAARAGAQFLVVAPDAEPLDAESLSALCDEVGIPVFSGWYRDARHLSRVQDAGAHGCAIGF